MSLVFEEADWPIVTLRIRGGLTPDEETLFTQRSVDYPLRRSPYIAIVDLLEASTPSARFVRLQASQMKRRERELAAYCRGVAFVIRSTMIRGALRAIFHFQELPCPHKVVRTTPEALAWAATRMASEPEPARP